MGKKSILFVFLNYSSFVKADEKILSINYQVIKYYFKEKKGFFSVIYGLFRQNLFILVNFWKIDAIFIWFADYHAFFPVFFAKLFKKKSYVVIGGFDVNYLKEFNYGAFNNPIRKYLVKKVIKNATMCFPVAKSLEKKLVNICPEAKIETIPTLQDHENFNFHQSERSKTIVTLSITDDYKRYMIKGLDRFCELATYLPEYEFKIIGVTSSAFPLFDHRSTNVKLLPPIDHEAIRGYYEEASFYLQLSRSEGLPNALCESMLCGCIPVGTDIGDIKETIDSSGLVINDWQPQQVAAFIRENHNNHERRILARTRIILNFDNEVRKFRFQNLI